MISEMNMGVKKRIYYVCVLPQAYAQDALEPLRLIVRPI